MSVSGGSVSHQANNTGQTPEEEEEEGEGMFTLKDPLIPISIALATAIVLILICLVVSFIFFRVQIILERRRKEPELLSYYPAVDSYRRQMIWDFEKNEYVKHLLTKVMATGRSHEDSGNPGSISSTINSINSSTYARENSPTSDEGTPISSGRADPRIKMDKTGGVITLSYLQGRPGRNAQTYTADRDMVAQVREQLAKHKERPHCNQPPSHEEDNEEASEVDSHVNYRYFKGDPLMGHGLMKTCSVNAISDDVFLSDNYTLTPSGSNLNGAQSPLTSSYFNMTSDENSLHSLYTSGASDFDENRRDRVLGGNSQCHDQMAVLSLSQLSMNIRSCPDSPLFIRPPIHVMTSSRAPDVEPGHRRMVETPICYPIPAFSTTVLDIVQGEARKRGLLRDNLFPDTSPAPTPPEGAALQLSSDGFCTSLSSESTDSRNYDQLQWNGGDDREMRTAF